MMKFINLQGAIQKARRASSGSVSIQESDVEEPNRLVNVLSRLLGRVVALESKALPEALEVEISFPASGDVLVPHNFNSNVRWWITKWYNAAGGHSLYETSDSDSNNLVLNSSVAGTGILRIESCQA